MGRGARSHRHRLPRRGRLAGRLHVRDLQLQEGHQRGQLRGREARPDGPAQQLHRQLQPDLTRPRSSVWRPCSVPGAAPAHIARSRRRISSSCGAATRARHIRSSSTTSCAASATAPASSRSTRAAPAGRVGRRVARPRRRLGHCARERGRPRDHRGRPGREPSSPARRRASKRTGRCRRAVHARVRRARDGRPIRRHPRAGPRVCDRRSRHALLDARHHRAPQRRRQRAGPRSRLRS